MKRNNLCLICCRSLEDPVSSYHTSCCRKLFNQREAPELPYAYSELRELAKMVVQSRITIPGVQVKLSLHLDNSLKNSSRFTLVGLWGGYILKPPVEEYPFMPEIEYMTMHLAGMFNIDTVPHGLIPLKSGELAYITRRIDRTAEGRKRHMEDMCQLNERLTEDKYRGSMEQIGKIIKKYSSNPMFDSIRFFEVALFSFLTGNADMHLKNFSLIYPVDQMVQLAPAYDLLSTHLLISEKDDPEETALTLNGKKRKFTREDFTKFAGNLGLNEKQLHNIFKRFAKALPETAATIARPILPREKIDAFDQLIQARAKRIGLM